MTIPHHSFAATLSSISISIWKDALFPDWLASICASIRTLNLWLNYACPGHSYPCDLRTSPGICYACSPKIYLLLLVLLHAEPPSIHMVCSSTSCSFHLNFPFQWKRQLLTTTFPTALPCLIFLFRTQTASQCAIESPFLIFTNLLFCPLKHKLYTCCISMRSTFK